MLKPSPATFTPLTLDPSHCGKLNEEKFNHNGKSLGQLGQRGQSPLLLGEHIATLDKAITFLNDWHIDLGGVETLDGDETRLAIGIRKSTDTALDRLGRLRARLAARRLAEHGEVASTGRASDIPAAVRDGKYRRGYIHGLVAAVDAIDAGATRQQLCNYLDDLNEQWRMTDTDKLIPPPTFDEWKHQTNRGNR